MIYTPILADPGYPESAGLVFALLRGDRFLNLSPPPVNLSRLRGKGLRLRGKGLRLRGKDLDGKG